MYKKLEKELGYNFKNVNLLELAFTHTSYANEHNMSFELSNERLEFLGDAVLQLIVSDYIYNKNKGLSEGDLSKLRANIVCEDSFAKNGKKLGLGGFLKLGKGEDKSGGRERDSIVADTFEAIIGAVFLDGGFFEAQKVIIGIIKPKMGGYIDVYEDSDYKTRLQEVVQAIPDEERTFGKTEIEGQVPLYYDIFKEEGPSHDRTFFANVKLEDEIIGTGMGKSKKEAEQSAAKNCLDMHMFKK